MCGQIIVLPARFEGKKYFKKILKNVICGENFSVTQCQIPKCVTCIYHCMIVTLGMAKLVEILVRALGTSDIAWPENTRLILNCEG